MLKKIGAMILTAILFFSLAAASALAEDQDRLQTQTRDPLSEEAVLQLRTRLHISGSTLLQQQDRLRTMDQTRLRFPDCEGHWAQNLIMSGWAFGLVDGYPDGNFHPEERVTGLEGLLMMTRMMQALEGIQTQAGPHEDIDWTGVPEWAKVQLQEQHALRLMEQTNYYLNEEMNRHQAAVMLAKGLAIEPVEVPVGAQLQFQDQNNIPAEDLGYVLALRNLGIVDGFPDGNFHPGEPVTRAQINVMIVRVLEILQEGQ